MFDESGKNYSSSCKSAYPALEDSDAKPDGRPEARRSETGSGRPDFFLPPHFFRGFRADSSGSCGGGSDSFSAYLVETPSGFRSGSVPALRLGSPVVGTSNFRLSAEFPKSPTDPNLPPLKFSGYFFQFTSIGFAACFLKIR